MACRRIGDGPFTRWNKCTHTHTNEIYRLHVCFLYAELNRDKLFTAIAKCNICHISDFLFIDLGWFWWCICSGGILPRVWNIWEKKIPRNDCSSLLWIIVMIFLLISIFTFFVVAVEFRLWEKVRGAFVCAHIKWNMTIQTIAHWSNSISVKKINNWKLVFHSSQTKIFTARPKIDLSDPFYVSICRIKFSFPKKYHFHVKRMKCVVRNKWTVLTSVCLIMERVAYFAVNILIGHMTG